MKTIGYMSFILISFTLFSASLFARDRSIGEFSEMIENLKMIQKESKALGTIPPNCFNCQKIEVVNKVVEINSIEIDLAELPIYKSETPFIVQLKRTKDSPPETSIKFKNGSSECQKLYVGAAGYGGGLQLNCMYSKTVYANHKIDIDLRKFPLPKENEEQIIELKMIKPDAEESFYTLDVSVINGPAATIKNDKKFWGNGYNVSLKEMDQAKGQP